MGGRMREWTTRQEEIVREFGIYGVERVQRELWKRCGVRRSRRAIESKASRIHVSLRVRTVCPECGLVGVRLNRQSGMCARCTELMHLNEEIVFNELLQAEREEMASDEDVAAIRRERDRIRQQNSRICRKFSLKSRRDRNAD